MGGMDLSALGTMSEPVLRHFAWIARLPVVASLPLSRDNEGLANGAGCWPRPRSARN